LHINLEFMNYRRIFIIGIGVLILGFFILYFVGANSSRSQSEAGNVLKTNDDASMFREQVVPLFNISNTPVVNFWLSETADIFYVTEQGLIIKNVTAVGTAVSQEEDPDIQAVKVSANGEYIFATTRLPGIGDAVFNIKAGQWNSILPDNINAAAWHPQDPNQLVLLRNDENGDSYLTLFQIDEGVEEKILPLNVLGADLIWNNSENVYIAESPSRLTVSSLFQIHLVDKTVRTITRQEPGLMIRWLNNALGLKLSSNTLSIIDNSGIKVIEMPILTLPDKCTKFTEETIFYCAVPETIGATQIPDDYLKGKTYFKDSIYRITYDPELNTVQIENIIPRDLITEPVNATELTYRSGIFYFINRYDRNLYSITYKEQLYK
jgi:hypothetical protein